MLTTEAIYLRNNALWPKDITVLDKHGWTAKTDK